MAIASPVGYVVAAVCDVFCISVSQHCCSKHQGALAHDHSPIRRKLHVFTMYRQECWLELSAASLSRNDTGGM
jgi:hypothetical protein